MPASLPPSPLARLRHVAGALLAVALVLPLSSTGARAAGPYPPGTWGNDISFPQCGQAYPSSYAFGIVGINGGYPFTTNPCLASEWAWATAASLPAMVYINTDDPPPTKARYANGNSGPAGTCAPSDAACHAYNYGVNAAAYALAAATKAGIRAAIWWLDVETSNCWTPDNPNCPNPDPTTSTGRYEEYLNSLVIQGNIDFLRSQGLQVGIYSTRLQFSIIAGGYAPGVPVWLADYQTSSPWQDCRPQAGFGGGQVWMVQTAPGQFDPDYSCPSPGGYWLVAADGGVFTLGASPFRGSTGGRVLNAPVVGMAPTVTGLGYWLVAADGGIFTFGDAQFYGSMGGKPLNQPVVGMAATPDGHGYWLVARDGGIFTFGDAQFFGSMGGKPLNQPVVGMAATPDGHGYWLVARDGGIFTFGDAQFFGSMGGKPLNQPVVGMAATPDGHGYWLVARDGGIFTFGDAPFTGSAVGMPLAPAVGMAASPSGSGYWLATADGTVVAFGDAPPYGGLGGTPLYRPIVGLATTPPGFGS